MSDRNAERNPLKRNTLLLLLSAAVLLAIAAGTLMQGLTFLLRKSA